MDFRGQRATVMGLGHFGGGVAAARWLAKQGALVTVTDLADENSLADSLALLADVQIAAFHLGGHREEDFSEADLIVVNPAVRPTSPWLECARQSGARLCTELELFMENCPARIVGVTGSNGKSTTAAMIASILKSAGRRTFLGGNMGGSLLEQLPQTAKKGTAKKGTGSFCLKGPKGASHKMCLSPFSPGIGADDWVVLEISSFQLWHFSPSARMPDVAVVTGCTPNHLDWHGSFSDYAAAKQRILAGQTAADLAVLNTRDAEVALWSQLVRGRQIPLPQFDELPELPVPGLHNRTNAACAAAAASGAGCTKEEIERGLTQFRPLPQRLAWFAVVDGRRFYNDSTSTTPESTIAALQSLEMPVWLLAGGKNKGCDLAPLAADIVARARGAALFGSVGEELRRLIAKNGSQFPCLAVETMEQALQWCWLQSRPSEAIVLSPGCASTDQFLNFQQRGERFVELVNVLANPVDR